MDCQIYLLLSNIFSFITNKLLINPIHRRNQFLMNIHLAPQQSKWIKDNPQHPFHFVNCKIATQKNNAFQLIDRVLAITTDYIYIYYYKQQDSSAQYQALNKSKSEPIPLEVLQCPQAKIQLKSFYSWTYFTQNDPSMIKYIQQILPSYANNVSKDLSLVLIKNNNDFQVFSLFLQNQELAQQLCSALDRTQIMKKCNKYIKDMDGQWNQRIIQMLCQAKKGSVIFDPQDFGFGWRKSYDLNNEQKQLKFVIDSLKSIIKDLSDQRSLSMELKFKIIDDQSGQYAYKFVSIDQCLKKVTSLSLKNCFLIQEIFESFMSKTEPLTKKITLKFPKLFSLDLSINKFTDNIFDSLDRLLQKNMFPQLYRLNLSRNYLALSPNSTYTLINFLSRVNYQLELNLAENRIVDCHFIRKYLINADRKSLLPIEYINLQKNKIRQQDKYKLLQEYLKRKAEDSKFSLIINLGEVTNFRELQVKYFQMLNKYFEQNQQLKGSSDSLLNQKDVTSMVFTRQRSNLSQSNSRISLISNPSGINLNLSNQKLINELFQSLTKLYVLGDYKQISLYRKQMQKNGITQKILTSSLSKQIQQKKKQQKRIANQMQRIVNFQINQKNVNGRLEEFVGLIRRRGIEGKAAQYLVYLKYKRDLYIQQCLKNKQIFEQNNPSYEILYKKMKSYTRIYKMETEQPDSFLQVDYQSLVDENDSVLYERFIKAKASEADVSKFDQKAYNRLKYLLLADEFINNMKVIKPMLSAVLLQLKLPLTRFLRYCKQMHYRHAKYLIKIKKKQNITEIQQLKVKNKVQILSKFDILNYQFNYSVDKSKLSGNPGILSRFSYDQSRYNDIIAFIEIVNNFTVFLYYTPQQISQQTLTYLVYIIQFLHNLSNQTKQDRQLKVFLIQQMFLHIMSYDGNTKLARGILAGIFQYLTSRLFCSQGIQKYIIAFLIKNEPNDIQNIKLSISTLNWEKSSLNLTKKVVRPDWFLLSPRLGSCLLNHLMIDIAINNRSNQPITMQFPQTSTVGQVWHQLQKRKFSNGNFEQNIFDRFGILKQQIPHFWIYHQKSISKIKYYEPLSRQIYIGQLVCINKIQNIHLKRAVYSERFHNRKVFKYQTKQTLLISLYRQISSNLFQCLTLISQSPQHLQPYEYQSQTTKDCFLNILAQILTIQLSIQEKTKLSELFSPEYRSNFSDQQFRDLYNQQKDDIHKSIIHRINDQFVTNFRTLNMDQKFKVSQLIKQKFRSKVEDISKGSLESVAQKIGNFIQKIGDWGYTQTLVGDQQIFVVNNRIFWIGSISHHTNQIGQVITSFTKLKQCIELKSIIGIQLKKNTQTMSQINFTFIKNLQESSNIKFSCQIAKIVGQSKFILNIYFILRAIAKNKIQWENRLLYNCQDIGIGNGNSKQISKKYLQNSGSQDQIDFVHKSKLPVKGLYWMDDIFYDQKHEIRNKQNQPLTQRSKNNPPIVKNEQYSNQNKERKQVGEHQAKAINKANTTQQNQLQQQYRRIQREVQQEGKNKEPQSGINIEIDPNHSQIQQIINQALNQEKQNGAQNQSTNDNIVTNRRRSSRKEPPRRRSSRQK